MFEKIDTISNVIYLSLFEELSSIQKLNRLIDNAESKVHSNNPKLLYKE